MRSCCSEHVSCIYRTTILAAVAFLDAFQKVADMATNSRGKLVFCKDVFVLSLAGNVQPLYDEVTPASTERRVLAVLPSTHIFSLLDLFCTTACRFLSLLGSWIQEALSSCPNHRGFIVIQRNRAE